MQKCYDYGSEQVRARRTRTTTLINYFDIFLNCHRVDCGAETGDVVAATTIINNRQAYETSPFYCCNVLRDVMPKRLRF
jgi:hypothetical protein